MVLSIYTVSLFMVSFRTFVCIGCMNVWIIIWDSVMDFIADNIGRVGGEGGAGSLNYKKVIM